MLSTRADRQQGFTLVELMVAVVAMFLIIGYTMSTFTYQHQTYVVMDQVSETQQNTRAIASLLERDIRNAGYLVPDEAATCGVDNDDQPDVLYLSDTDAVRPVDELSSTLASKDLGAEVVGSPGTGASVTVSVDNLVIDGQASYDTDADGTNDSDFRVNSGAILVDTANPTRGARCGVVTAVSLSTPKQVTVAFAQSDFGSGASIAPTYLLIPAHVYAVGAGPPPELRRDGQLLAKDVEDLQVAWFFDADVDGQADAGEYRGASGTTYDAGDEDGNELREIRINLVTRTRENDPRNPDAAGRGQSMENRDTAVPGDDGRRRRTHSATVRVRNVTE